LDEKRTIAATPRYVGCGCLVRRECWALSRRGKLVFLMVLPALVMLAGWKIYPFLSVNNGGTGEILVVEGWISTRRVEEAAQAFHRGHYRRVVVVRNVYREGNNWESGRYTADWVAADLVEKGVPKEMIQLLFCPVVRKDRTYSCAVAVRQWLEQHSIPVTSIDVATVAIHTRRSRLLYEKAFGNRVSVGMIALPDVEYDPDHWWRSSEGVREVPFELVAYLYARLFFSP
jgi:hypothetical protein